MTPFDPDTRPLYEDVTTVPSPFSKIVEVFVNSNDVAGRVQQVAVYDGTNLLMGAGVLDIKAP